uniref:Uncharacterized protein n=1 Tax=Orbilia brochopaga TaxID=3140254 RepID=A0A4Y5MZX7_9PEZI|nr:hypothetical protein [Drechslerella brochopaga]
MCCVTWNSKLITRVESLVKVTKKHPTPSTKPDIQCGSWILGAVPITLIWGLIWGTMSGKALFNWFERPLLKTAFKDKTFFKPSIVKCSLDIIKSNVCLNSW